MVLPLVDQFDLAVLPKHSDRLTHATGLGVDIHVEGHLNEIPAGLRYRGRYAVRVDGGGKQHHRHCESDHDRALHC